MTLRNPIWLYLATLIAILCGALPLLAGHPAALEDWPSHVARIEILTRVLAGNAFWSRFYQVNTFMLPNVSVDICVLALHAVGFPVALAAQMTLLLTYVLFVASASALAWALRVFDPFKPLLAAIVFYNGALMDGFVNYMMGAAVALCFVAAWIYARRLPWRVLIAMVGGVVVFFCHLVAAGFFLAVLGLLELASLALSGRWNIPTLLRHASPLAAIVPILVLFALSPTSGGLHIFYGRDLSVLEIVKTKLSLFVHPMLDGSGWLGATILLIGTVLFVGTMIVAWRRGQLMPRPLPGWQVLVPGLIALFLVLPNGVGRGSWPGLPASPAGLLAGGPVRAVRVA